MHFLFLHKKLVSLILFFCVQNFFAQSHYHYAFSKVDDECTKGSAGIQIDTLKPSDMLTITWSNGQNNVFSIINLDDGDYVLHVVIKAKPDTVIITKADTTIRFKIEKIECPVKVSNQFTPNGDNYNDHLQIYNVDHYPNFELFIFNQWGQQVHSQKQTYTPWDGKWNSINVPDGTYYYVFYFDASHKHKLLKGDITILR